MFEDQETSYDFISAEEERANQLTEAFWLFITLIILGTICIWG